MAKKNFLKVGNGTAKKSTTQNITSVPVQTSTGNGQSMVTLNAHPSEGNFNNVSIKSADKYNSIVGQKKSIGSKHRPLNINDHTI